MQFFHVIFQSFFGTVLFYEREDYLTYLRFAKRACEKYKMRWLAFALMPNHIHLVLCGEREQLPHLRYNVSSGYAAYYRKKYSVPRKQPVFQVRNTTKWIQMNHDLQQVLRYVNRNPMEGGFEQVLGESCNSSYNAILAAREPDNMLNPFNAYDELREIRNTLDTETVYRAFGKNHSEQRENFIAFHRIASSEPVLSGTDKSAATWGAKHSEQLAHELQKAEVILKRYFAKRYSLYGKEYNAQNRQTFLNWLSRRGNQTKTCLVLSLSAETALSSRQIADFLQIGRSTVQNIIKVHKK